MVFVTYRRALVCMLLLSAGSTSSAEPPVSAADRFQSLQTRLRDSRRANDWRASLTSAKALKELLNGTPVSLLEVARAQVAVGNLDAAWRELDEFVHMGQVTDRLATSVDFAPLRESENFSRIQGAMIANRSPVSTGATAFQLSDPGLLAEDVDYDPKTRRFFVTSVREKKILSVGSGGASSDFAAAPDHWPMLAVKVDSSRRLLWATEVAMNGYSFAPEPDWGRSAVLCYDLSTAKLLRRVEGPRGTALSDMALMANGDVIVSDGEAGGVYRLPVNATALDRLDDGDFLSPQTPAPHPDGKHIFVPDYLRGIAVLDVATKRARWLSMAHRFALNGIDGLYFDHGKLIAVENGTSPERVVVFTLDATLTRVESEAVIERSTSTLGDPTHGVVVENEFYYIANSGWDHIDERGNPKKGTEPSPPRIMRARSH